MRMKVLLSLWFQIMLSKNFNRFITYEHSSSRGYFRFKYLKLLSDHSNKKISKIAYMWSPTDTNNNNNLENIQRIACFRELNAETGLHE